MRKRTVEKLPAPPFISAAHDRKLQAAIESVFRLTHGREMTPEERRLFGLAGRRVQISAANENYRNGRPDGKAAGKPRP